MWGQGQQVLPATIMEMLDQQVILVIILFQVVELVVVILTIIQLEVFHYQVGLVEAVLKIVEHLLAHQECLV
jgi:hypothetical protein